MSLAVLFLALVPFAVGHYRGHNNVVQDTYRNDNGYDNYEDDVYNDPKTDDIYASEEKYKPYDQPMRGYRQDETFPPPPPPPPSGHHMRPPFGGPPPFMMAVLNNIAKQAQSEKNVNLKVSGKIEMVKSFKGTPPWMMMHGRRNGLGNQERDAEQDYRWGKTVQWMEHIHDDVHKILRQYEKDDDDVEDEEEEEYEDEDEYEDEERFHHHKPSGIKSHSACPFRITKQFLKLCKCPTINKMMKRVSGRPLEQFETDPMRVFENTKGLEEMKSGNMKSLLMEIQDMTPSDMKKLFYFGMIKSMCGQAKNYMKKVEMFEKAAKAKAKSSMTYPQQGPSVPEANPEEEPADNSKVGRLNPKKFNPLPEPAVKEENKTKEAEPM